MTMTTKALTGEQIRKLRGEAMEHGDYAMGAICDLAEQGEIDTDDYSTLGARDVKRIRAMSQDDAYAAIISAINGAAAQE